MENIQSSSSCRTVSGGAFVGGCETGCGSRMRSSSVAVEKGRASDVT